MYHAILDESSRIDCSRRARDGEGKAHPASKVFLVALLGARGAGGGGGAIDNQRNGEGS